MEQAAALHMRAYSCVAQLCCPLKTGQHTWSAREGAVTLGAVVTKLRANRGIYTSATPHTSLLLSLTDRPFEAQSRPCSRHSSRAQATTHSDCARVSAQPRALPHQQIATRLCPGGSAASTAQHWCLWRPPRTKWQVTEPTHA